jgi:hypothetical protein
MDSRSMYAGTGFVLHDGDGHPCVTFGYSNEAAAKEAAEHLRAVLSTAQEGALAS